MKLHNQSGFRALTRCRLILSLLLVLLVVCNAVAGIRRPQISRQFQPSRIASRTYFPLHGRYGGGVVPRGSADFLSPAKVTLGAGQLQLVILDKAKLRNDRPDYDAIGIRWKGNVYTLSTQDDLIYPLMKFVQRGSFIAYTMHEENDDDDPRRRVASQRAAKAYFQSQGLRLTLGGLECYMADCYVAKEFESDPHTEFLSEIDLKTKMERMPADADAIKLSEMVMRDLKGGSGPLTGLAPDPFNDSLVSASWVNADFHIKYSVFLDNVDGKNVADVGGLPLRYHWKSERKRDGTVETSVHKVDVFKFPEDEVSLQYRAVLFFQTAAILRQFSEENPLEFRRFLREVGTVMGNGKVSRLPRRR